MANRSIRKSNTVMTTESGANAVVIASNPDLGFFDGSKKIFDSAVGTIVGTAELLDTTVRTIDKSAKLAELYVTDILADKASETAITLATKKQQLVEAGYSAEQAIEILRGRIVL